MRRLVVRFIDGIPLPDSIDTLLFLIGIDADQIVGDTITTIPNLSMVVAFLATPAAKLLEKLPIVKYIEEDTLLELIPPEFRGTPVSDLQAQSDGTGDGGTFLEDGEFIPYGIEMVQALTVSDENIANHMLCIIDSGFDIEHPDLPSSTDVVSGAEDLGVGPWFEVGHSFIIDFGRHDSSCI